MLTKYKAATKEEAYFITITTVGWIGVFTRLNQKANINKGTPNTASCVKDSKFMPIV